MCEVSLCFFLVCKTDNLWDLTLRGTWPKAQHKFNIVKYIAFGGT